MALITCPECGQSISNVADKCPHCGLPQSYFNPQTTAIQSNPQYQDSILQERQPQMSHQQINYHDNNVGGRAVKIAKPNNYLALAIISIGLGSLLFGIVSLVYSLKVDSLYANGNYTEAVSASNKAMIWAIVAIIFGLISIFAFLLASGIIR